MRLLIPVLALLFTVSAVADDEKSPPEPVKTFDRAERDKVMNEMGEAHKRFESMSQEYDLEMKSLVLREVRSRKRFLERSYGRRIGDIDVLRRQRRLEAIAALRRFVARYPNHPKHTPDTMFRLAELYFEKAQVDHEVMLAGYERDVDLYDRGKVPEEPKQPKVNFAESTKLYDEIIRRFRSYRYRDVCFYMKGYTQYQTGLEREARDTWLALATKYPKSKYAPEAWLRIGEYHFDYGEWKLAEKAYSSAAEYKESKFHDMVLYKLAWTYFQQFDYDRAIKGFLGLIAAYDAKGKAGALGSALREEAVQYLARSLAEDDWNGDGEVDADAGVQRALAYLSTNKGFEREILLEYAKSLYDLHEPEKYKESAVVYRTLIDRNKLDPKNPELHERLIETYDLAHDVQGAARERDELVKRYAKGTPWYQANLQNAGATSRADRLVEAALRQRAKFHHATAQNLKVRSRTENDPALLGQAIAEYEKAATAYRQYLQQYPHRRDANEIRFLLAEALYYSNRHLAAATAYAVVRDLPGKNEYRELAAFSAIKSVERRMELMNKAGKLPGKALAMDAADPPAAKQTDKRGTKITRVKPKKLPKVVLPWIEHSDKYAEMKLVHEDDKDFTTKQAYRIALMYFNYRHYDEARKRFEAIIKAYPLKQEASFSAMNIINSYKDENDWANIEVWTERVAKEGIGRPEDVAALRKQLKAFKLGQQFDRAVALLQEKQYVAAAEEFERIVNGDPKSKVADKALFNAAIAFQNAKHYNSAARVFERVATEPQFKGTPFREQALFYMSENNRRFFSFEKSVHGYLALLKSFPKSKWNWYALDWSAQLEEMQGNFGHAAALYERYSNDFNERDDAPQKLFQAALVYQKMKDPKSQIRILNAFIKRYKDNPLVSAKIVEANLRLAVLSEKEVSWRTAKKYYEKTIEEFEARGLKPQSAAAEFAAQASFTLIDRRFRVYEKMVLKGSLANQGRTIQAKRKMLGELQTEYESLVPYKAFGWTIAAFHRIGQLYKLFAKMLYDAPDPPGLDDEQMDEYRTMVEDEGLKWENVAIERFEVAVKAARDLKIVNNWSQVALKALNKYKPQEYPLFKSEKRAYETHMRDQIPLTLPEAPVIPPEPIEGEGAADEPKTPVEIEPEVPVPGEEPAPHGGVPQPDKTEPTTQPDPTAPPVEAPAPEPEPADELDIPVPDETEDGN